MPILMREHNCCGHGIPVGVLCESCADLMRGSSLIFRSYEPITGLEPQLGDYHLAIHYCTCKERIGTGHLHADSLEPGKLRCLPCRQKIDAIVAETNPEVPRLFDWGEQKAK